MPGPGAGTPPQVISFTPTKPRGQAPLLHLQLGCTSLEPLGLGLTLHSLIPIWSLVPDPPCFPVDHRSPIHEPLGIREDLHSQVEDPLPFWAHLHLARNT